MNSVIITHWDDGTVDINIMDGKVSVETIHVRGCDYVAKGRLDEAEEHGRSFTMYTYKDRREA